MGISGFWQWFSTTQINSFVALPEKGNIQVEHLLLDLNGLLHTLSRHTTSYVSILLFKIDLI